MYRSRQPRRITSITSDLKEGAIVVVVISAIIAVIGYGVFAIDTSVTNGNNKSNIELLRLLDSYGDAAEDSSEAAKEDRKERAQFYLNTEFLAKRVSDESEQLGFSDDQWKQVERVAETGKPAKLDTEIGSYTAPFGWPVLPMWLLVTWIAAGLLALVFHADSDRYSRYRLADVDWKRPSTWFVTVAFGPLFWLAMVISRVLLHRTPYETVYEPPDYDEGTHREDPVAEEAPPQKAPNPTYMSAPGAARATYVSLRTDASKSYQAARLKQIETSIEGHQEAARELGAELKETQKELNKLRATRVQLEQTLESEVVTAEVADQEFDRIARLPGVIATQVVNDRVRLVIRATHEYKGTVYDLGDWQIDLHPAFTSLGAQELRSGTRRDWEGYYPVYRYGSGRFCFGDRQEVLDEHLRKGQYLEAVSVAIDCLCGVNEEDRRLVPDAFYAITN